MHTHDHRPPWAHAVTDQPPFRGRRGQGPHFGGPGGPGSFFGHGPRANRGDIRAAILALLAEAPMHGYQVIQEIGTRSGGVWTPSPGSVYPTLQHLEDEGLIASEQGEGKKVFSLTEAGRATNPGARAPWEEVGVDARLVELRDGIGQVANAVRQIARGGTPAQVKAAKTVLADTRRALYRILAEDDA
ncbi:MAG: PadR family transcriptional regulator [Actinomycetota bacterium]|nr:PadR family transcriptional regulator [Actinomycetota bacterium]